MAPGQTRHNSEFIYIEEQTKALRSRPKKEVWNRAQVGDSLLV